MSKAATVTLAVVVSCLSVSSVMAGVDPGVPDTIWMDAVTWDADTAFSMGLYTVTDDSLEHATIILSWSTSQITIDSVSVVGSRWETQVTDVNGTFVATPGQVGGVPSAVHYNISFLPFGQKLPTGSGLACRIFWSKTTTVTQANIIVDSATTSSGGAVVNHTLFGTTSQDADNFVPQFEAGQITADLCDCPLQADIDGNIQIDPLDLNSVIDILFFAGVDPQDPLCPVTRADFNCDDTPDPVDLNALIDYLFFAGPLPCDPCVP